MATDHVNKMWKKGLWTIPNVNKITVTYKTNTQRQKQIIHMNARCGSGFVNVLLWVIRLGDCDNTKSLTADRSPTDKTGKFQIQSYVSKDPE
jgi:hypothetical protein